MQMKFEKSLKELLNQSAKVCATYQSMYVTYEHMLLALCDNPSYAEAYKSLGGNVDALKKDLVKYIKTYIPITNKAELTTISSFTEGILMNVSRFSLASEKKNISLGIFFRMAIGLNESFGNYYIAKNMDKDVTEDDYLRAVCSAMQTTYVSEEDLEKYLNTICPELTEEDSKKPKTKSKNWKQYVTNVNEEVKDRQNIIGREQEIEDTIEVLLRKNKSNPVHIGESGVGKTSITYGLAARINEGNVPDKLKGKTIYRCDVSSIVENASYLGVLERRLKDIFEGIIKENAILFIDELHVFFSGTYPTAVNTIETYLTHDNVSVIGSATTEDYRMYIEKDASLERRLSPIVIKEPTNEEMENILNGVKERYENFHQCLYSEAVIKEIVNLSGKYMRDRNFPDKAIDVMDEAGANVNAKGTSLSDRVISIDIIGEVIARKCNIAKEIILRSAEEDMRTLPEHLKEIVIGQDEAIDKITENLLISRAGLRGENKPIANLLFVGPTGVGKTFIAETLSKELNLPLIRKDMSEFSESHSVSKLFGSPAGYVGYGEGGMLVNEIRQNPNCILLLDEIEKAHPVIFDSLLQIMDNAEMTDGLGKKADFRNVIIIMTSNAGAADAEKRSMGFGSSTNEDAMIKEVKLAFKPEFRNRLDAIIQFHPLSEEMAVSITINQINELCRMLEKNKVELTVDKTAVDYIIKKGYSKEYGARNIKRIIEKDLKVPLSKAVLFGELKGGGNATLSFIDDKITLKKEAAI